MNTQTLQGSWNQVRGKLKERWANLTDDDLRFREGNIDQLIGRIQQKTGEARETIEGVLDHLTSSGASFVSQAAQTVGNTSQEAAERLREQVNLVAEHAGQQYQEARRFVRRNPGQSMAAVLGVGFAMGLFVGLVLKSR